MYLGCVVPYSGHGISITVALSQFAKVHGWDPHTTVIGAGGTNTIVGSNYRATPTLKNYWAILCIGIFVCSMQRNCRFERSLPVTMGSPLARLHSMDPSAKSKRKILQNAQWFNSAQYQMRNFLSSQMMSELISVMISSISMTSAVLLAKVR